VISGFPAPRVTFPRPLIRTLAELCRDLVRRSEADAADVARQPIWILRDESNGIGAVGFVDAHRARRADTIAVQKQHDLSRITFCSAQPAMIRSARFGPIPVTSRRRLGSCSMMSNTASRKARTSFFA
jgi:hypothetical protein